MYDQVSHLESIAFNLDEIVKVLDFTLENLEEEIGMPEGKEDECIRAMCLYKRMDYYSAVFRMVTQRISATKQETTAVSDQLYQEVQKAKGDKQ